MYTPFFSAALFAVAKLLKQPVSTSIWMEKEVEYIYTVKYCLVIKEKMKKSLHLW